MKNPILIALVLSFVFSSISFAGTEMRQIKSGDDTEGVIYVRPFCVQGKQFIAVVHRKNSPSNGSGGVSVVQVMDQATTKGNPPQPAICKEDSPTPSIWR